MMCSVCGNPQVTLTSVVQSDSGLSASFTCYTCGAIATSQAGTIQQVDAVAQTQVVSQLSVMDASVAASIQWLGTVAAAKNAGMKAS